MASLLRREPVGVSFFSTEKISFVKMFTSEAGLLECARKFLVPVPTEEPEPTREMFLEKWSDVLIEYVPEEGQESLSFSETEILQKVYGLLMMTAWINFYSWGATELRKVCNNINVHVFENQIAFVCIATKHSYGDDEEWKLAQAAFKENVNSCLDHFGVGNK